MKRSVVFVLLFFITITLYSQPKREMRAVWVATVANIDFPSKPGISTVEQKQEIIDILERQQALGMNTIIFQIRPASDALYKSDIEPWSKYLTGEQGKAPDPQYDPLKFIIEECHKRSMKLHAWINPYRVLSDTANADKTDSLHITKKHPEWLVSYGKKTYFDPGLPETRAYVTRVVKDIVSRYDVDAIHMDDYFYPYRIKGKEFPDSSSFKEYPRGFSQAEKDDWRRDNVNKIVKMFQDTIRSVDPTVQLGISPFGVWRNKSADPDGSPTNAGQTNYDDLFADVLKWLKKDWIDYVAPQIYWHIGFEPADFAKLIKWWNSHAYGKELYIGHGAYRIGNETDEWNSRQQMPRQIEMTRKYENVDGSVFFTENSFRDNPKGLNRKLKRHYYEHPALPPEITNLPDTSVASPKNLWLKELSDKKLLDWDESANAHSYVIYRFKGETIGNLNNPENIYKITNEPDVEPDRRWHLFKRTYTFVVTAVNKKNEESEPSNSITVKIR